MSAPTSPATPVPLKVSSRLTGQEWVLQPGEVVELRRDPEARIFLTHEKVSRTAHARLELDGPDWVLLDAGSNNGLHVNGQRRRRVTLTGRVVVRFGTADEGEDLVFDLLAGGPSSADRVRMPATKLGPPRSGGLHEARPTPRHLDGQDETQLTPAGGPGPLRVSVGGGPFAVLPPSGPVLVGRSPDADVMVDHPSVSRHHASLSPTPGGWRFTDTSSRGNTWRGGDPAASFLIDRPVELVLGDQTTGPRVRLQPEGGPVALAPPAPSGRRRRTIVLAVAAAALVALGIVASVRWATAPADTVASVPAPVAGLEVSKRATVKLAIMGTQDEYLGSGSGVIFDKSGLILTNAHVAAPKGAGLGYQYDMVSASEAEVGKLLVGIGGERDDIPVDYKYQAKRVSVDGYLDLTVIKVTAMADGSALPADFALPVMEVGDSKVLKTGDGVTILGFPSVSRSDSLTVTTGVVSTFVPDPRLDSNRAIIDTDGRGSPGNSGGPVTDATGRLVGIFSATGPDQNGTTVVSGRFRPIELATDVLSRGRAGNTDDTGSAHLPSVRGIQGSPLGIGLTSLDCRQASTNTTVPKTQGAVAVMFYATGVPSDGKLFLSLRKPAGGFVDLSGTDYTPSWAPSKENTNCPTFTVPADTAGSYTAELWTDPAGERPLAQLPLTVTG